MEETKALLEIADAIRLLVLVLALLVFTGAIAAAAIIDAIQDLRKEK